MNNRLRRRGFTLVEILVAVALIGIVLSMTYGSYFAISRSARACSSRIALSEEGRKTLEQIARHVRCSYAGPVSDNKEKVQTGSDQTEIPSKTRVSYFNGGARSSGGEILHLVTTSGLPEGQWATEGLFDVVYRFDKRTRELALSLSKFVGTAKDGGKRDWLVIADQIDSVGLEFFDGEKWLDDWDFEEKNGLPHAVRIEIGGEDESLQLYDYSTVAYVSCRYKRPVTRTKTVGSVDK